VKAVKLWLEVAVVIALFYVGYGLQQQNALPGGNSVMAAEDEGDLKWEQITGNYHPHLRRAKILGGWLVCAGDSTPQSVAVSVTFVPDIYHEWDGKSMK